MGILLQSHRLLHQDPRTLETIGGHHSPLRILRPAGRDLEHHASRYTCGFRSLPLNLGQCERGWSCAHVPKASRVETVHELRQHLRPFACEMLCAHVRGVCFRGDLLHCELPAAHRLLERQVLNLDVLRFVQACSAQHGQESMCSQIGTALWQNA